MLYDTRGIAVTTDSATAMAALDGAVTGLLAHRSDTGTHLAATLAADPALAAGHCLAGFALLLRGRAALVPAARQSLAAAQRSLRERGGTDRERRLCAALAAWCDGEMRGCVDRLADALADAPLDAMTAKLDHAIRFMLGDVAGMRRVGAALLPAWRADVPGYGFVFGCHAFTLEESGDLDAAERLGRRAVAAEPGDAWAHHAVAHVFHARGDAAGGKAWLDAAAPRLADVNNFAAHLAWHRALFCLARRGHEEALAIFDGEIRTSSGDDYRDVANAASLLRRLETAGIAIGDRWEALAAIAATRTDDDALVFARLHYLMSLLGAGRREMAAALRASLQRDARRGRGTQSRVAAEIGVAMADAMIAAAADDDDVPVLRERLAALGGSHVQREIFHAVLDAPERRPMALPVSRLPQRDPAGVPA